MISFAFRTADGIILLAQAIVALACTQRQEKLKRGMEFSHSFSLGFAP
jgi:hypothetical protein